VATSPAERGRRRCLKSLKLAIESELKANRPRPILPLQAESHSTRSECCKYLSHVLEKESGVPFISMGKQFVACRACLHTYAFTSDKGTTALNNPTKTRNIEAANAEAGSINGFTHSRTISAREKRRVCRAAAIMCCKDLRPFSFCEGSGFKHFAAVLLDVGARSKSAVNIDDLLSKSVIDDIVHVELQTQLARSFRSNDSLIEVVTTLYCSRFV
jgi:hypothetical protein